MEALAEAEADAEANADGKPNDVQVTPENKPVVLAQAGTTPDTSTLKGPLPKTGVTQTALAGLLALITGSVSSYIKQKKLLKGAYRLVG